MTEVKQIMKKCPVELRPETTLAEAAQILSGHHVDGAPVVTAERAIVGMISEHQLLDVVFDLAARETPVSEYMSREPVVLAPADPLPRAAQLFALYAFRRLPVVENEKLVGIVSRCDLINYALQSTELLTEPLVDLVPELAPMS
jgi:CBS domain-containing protein